MYIANYNQLILHLHRPWSLIYIFPFCSRRWSVMLGRWTMYDSRIQDNIVMRLNHGFFRYEGYLIITLPFSSPLTLAEFLFLIKEYFFHESFSSRSSSIFRKVRTFTRTARERDRIMFYLLHRLFRSKFVTPFFLK